MAISEIFHSALLENANIQKEYYLLEYEKRRRESQKYKNSKIFSLCFNSIFLHRKHVYRISEDL